MIDLSIYSDCFFRAVFMYGRNTHSFSAVVWSTVPIEVEDEEYVSWDRQFDDDDDDDDMKVMMMVIIMMMMMTREMMMMMKMKQNH